MNTSAFDYEASFGTPKQLPQKTLPEAAFAGRSNVGKSTLINCLLGRKNLARVSGVPGKTITVNFYSDKKIRLVDLPGYGYAKRSEAEYKRFAALMEGYFAANRADLVVQLLDMRHAPSKDDITMLDFLRAKNVPFAAVLTKSDKLNKTQFAARLAQMEHDLSPYAPRGIIPFSSIRKQGLDPLRELIERYFF
ncbi:MAG: ribosome biogenesis GTP-binding protein YihA/YsxC [Oscillospiraceae bacterium]|jgi:GTP-binding protein|nr:ribosome biogenesis GTP-binding protein YihA/YsxC [Oscillospiraceae bacterium]